ncbi:MAG: NAD(P)H-hydrate dehydratase [Actinomycetota bacterium]
MLLIAGTVPIKENFFIEGEAELKGDHLLVDGHEIPCTQGTASMVSAAAITTDYLGIDAPYVILAGDIGDGRGSKMLFRHLIDDIPKIAPRVLALHYFLPIIPLIEKVMVSVKKCAKRPILIADAGAMYAAKAAGLSSRFDVFTPDAGEMAFLADPDATHPAYIRHHLFETDIAKAPGLIKAAFDRGDLPKTLLVKGPKDYIANHGEILATIDEPNIPSMEAIGGTGDTITGLISAFVHAELESHEAAIIAAKTNRMAGKFANVTPASKIWEVISQFPAVFKEYLCKWTGICLI